MLLFLYGGNQPMCTGNFLRAIDIGGLTVEVTAVLVLLFYYECSIVYVVVVGDCCNVSVDVCCIL